MSNFCLLSDLHQEFHNAEYTFEFPNAKYCLLAGDITTPVYLQAHQTDKHSRGLYKRMRAFFDRASAHFEKVFYVFGNHEYYHGEWFACQRVMKEFLSCYDNVFLLENDYHELDDCVVLGATLWTSVNGGDPLTIEALRVGMNDYHVCFKAQDGDKGNFAKLHPNDTFQTHVETVKWITDTAALFPNKKIVMMSHHGPSYKSIHPKYANDNLLNGGYVSNLDYVCPDNVVLWVHGHTHHSFDYEFGQNARLIVNPRGYAKTSDENPRFNPNLVIDL